MDTLVTIVDVIGVVLFGVLVLAVIATWCYIGYRVIKAITTSK